MTGVPPLMKRSDDANNKVIVDNVLEDDEALEDDEEKADITPAPLGGGENYSTSCPLPNEL